MFKVFKNVSSLIKIKFLLILILFSVIPDCLAQVKNHGALYIGNNTTMHIKGVNFDLGNTSGGSNPTIVTNRVNVGYVNFDQTATMSNGNNTNAIDGYVKTSKTNFLSYLRHGTFYRQVGIENSNNLVTLVVGAGVNTDTLDQTVSKIQGSGRVFVTGSGKCRISIGWTNSITDVVTNIGDLIIVGLKGNTWYQIPSTVDSSSLFPSGVSNLTTGNISTDYDINLTEYTRYTLGSKKDACSVIIESSGLTKTWNGTTWTPSAPTIQDNVVINGAYNHGSLKCNSITINSSFTLENDHTLEVVGDIINCPSTKIVMASGANLIQRLGTASKPYIDILKKTALTKYNDQIYFGLPLSQISLSSSPPNLDLINAQISLARGEGGTEPAFDNLKIYKAGQGGGWVTLTNDNFAKGKGYIGRVRYKAPFLYGNKAIINVPFSGISNNGNIDINVVNNPSDLNHATNFNLLGNPYPSAIDASTFLKHNSSMLEEVLYVWKSPTEYTFGNYNVSDYLVYNRTGSVVTHPEMQNFDGKIPSGQGFMVKVKPNSIPGNLNSGNVTFTNCMRINTGNNIFYRIDNQNEVDENAKIPNSYKLNLTNSQGNFSQILISYMDEATPNYDSGYDADRNSVSPTQLYSLIENGAKKLAINALPTFDIHDEVKIGTSKTTSGNITNTISLHETSGIFANSQGVNVYIKDNVTNSYHNLSEGNFTFTINSNEVNNRYSVVYQSSSLGLTDNKIITTYGKSIDNILLVESNKEIQKIEVYDISGRLIDNYKVNGYKRSERSFSQSNGVYLLKVYHFDNFISNVKIIHAN